MIGAWTPTLRVSRRIEIFGGTEKAIDRVGVGALRFG